MFFRPYSHIETHSFIFKNGKTISIIAIFYVNYVTMWLINGAE